MTTFHTLSGYNVATTISVPAINFDPVPEQWTIDQGVIAGATGISADGVDRWLIPLSQVRPYLVAARSRQHDFGPRFARCASHPVAFRLPSFCDVALA